MSSEVDSAVEELRSGRCVVLPTDTVYGLCAHAFREEPVLRLYRVKGRPETEPVALVASSLELLFECVPELRGRAGVIARALLPGPYTLVLPNPARRFRWLTGSAKETIGVRVPVLPKVALDVLERVGGAVAATSANLPGGKDPARLEEVPDEIASACGALLDGGELPGVPSTVLDLTGREPHVLREGAGSAQAALERVEAV